MKQTVLTTTFDVARANTDIGLFRLNKSYFTKLTLDSKLEAI